MQLIGVTPSDQHLMFKGVELVDYKKTLQDLGIPPDSMLHLWTDSPPMNATTVQLENSQLLKVSTAPKGSIPPKNNAYKNQGAPLELGFKGTRLLEN
ncbi:unnamed protein product [Echinostoma caproni]|nr:unnamed protein product [Echinostoma caproni]